MDWYMNSHRTARENTCTYSYEKMILDDDWKKVVRKNLTPDKPSDKVENGGDKHDTPSSEVDTGTHEDNGNVPA